MGHYWNSENAKQEFEDTGSREICGFFDLANTYKILAEDEGSGGFWLAGGAYSFDGVCKTLAGLELVSGYYLIHYGGVAWLVLKKQH